MELLWVMVVGVFLGGCALWNNHKQEWRDKIDMGWGEIERDHRLMDQWELEIQSRSYSSNHDNLLSDDDNELLDLLNL
jgi:hypothetical protein